MNEASFRRKVSRAIEKAGGHASAVESHATSPGIPDVDFCIDGVEGHIELKIAGNGGMRPTQLLWFRQRVRAGANPWIMVWSPQNTYLIAGEFHEMVKTTKKEDMVLWEAIATKIWKSMPSHEELAIGLKTNPL